MGTPLYREDDNVFLGLIEKDETSWLAQTIFGYTIARATSREEAEAILHERGTSYLKGVWQYYDKDDRDWFPCVIQGAHEQKVTVVRTNDLGYQDPDNYKHVILENPDDTTLLKMS